MKVEEVLHELSRITLEVAPLIVIGEAGGCDPRPRRQHTEHLDVLFVERAVYRLKLIVLVFAQGLLSRQSAIQLSTVD